MVCTRPGKDTAAMKNKTLFLTCLSAVVLTVSFVTGCASDNYQKGAGTATALKHSSELIAKGSSQIDDSLGALNDLVSNPQPDLTKQYNAYTVSVDNLDATAKDVAAKNEAMQAQGAAYFEGWDNEIATMQNEDIRSRSEVRRNEVAKRFAAIKDTAAKSTRDAVPLKETLARLSEQFKEVSASMSPITAVN